MIVMKFGGSSVANAERIRHVADIVARRIAEKPVLVLSAMGDTTDHLLEAADKALNEGLVVTDSIEKLHLDTVKELGLESTGLGEVTALLKELNTLLTGISMIKELTGKTRDYLVSFGERLSVRIVAAYLNSISIQARALDSWDAGFLSDSNFSSAELEKDSWNLIPKALLPLIGGGLVPVVTGFIARDRQGNITTLGRGGSDLSATMIASALKADEAQVWKDVDGILTADPRLVKKARPVETVTYEEAAELAYFGAQVLHPRAMQPCIKTGTPVRVKNSYNPDAPGTRIVGSLDKKAGPVRAITSRKNVTLVDIVSTRMVGQHGFLAEVFTTFAEHKLSVDMVATSEVSVSLTLDADHELGALKQDLSRIASVEIRTGKAIVTIVGDVRRSSEILQRAFGTCVLLGIQVQMISQGASKVNISFIVDDTQAGEVVIALHKCFFEPLSKEERL
ncbi:lysine-sensitive aspartokinase 3 (Lysine-sensitiveaspartokinase III) (Aspartate kinase III) [Treponema primitia ZAS-2]|uniref:Aspartokinase n=1 Tax=Treponema primitia (strain ATCC BAA-887 / DSM 12427 / ZAS-2) TaxID=545694 RepID=F5YNK9_TREPZ|nr:aspartate kinase [Treponema primitia]AEF84490.1 lysine-sensitive aspartokinase 3 (Lysine-sensitiveaspartokinase III) (Aspartate kinase III) [Treponema primitia ZAS-2]